MKKNLILTALILVVSGATATFAYRGAMQEAWYTWQKPDLPEAREYEDFEDTDEKQEEPQSPAAPVENTPPENVPEQPSQKNPPAQTSLPSQINLAVPFASQAPFGNWGLPYQEACEETSLIMVARYKNGEAITGPEDAAQEINSLVDFENTIFGYYKDTTAEETARIAREFYGFADTEVRYEFSVDDIKRELAEGNPIIIPAAGRKLGNPYFQSPGPIYHMLVIRGYTATHFITNDPGTRRGEEFLYTYAVLMNAVHDWNDGDVESGRKAMIVLK